MNRTPSSDMTPLNGATRYAAFFSWAYSPLSTNFQIWYTTHGAAITRPVIRPTFM